MQPLTQWVVGSLSATGVMFIYLISDCLSANSMITLACCLFAFDRFIENAVRFDRTLIHPSFTCSQSGVLCSMRMLSENNTRILYFSVWLGGSIVLHVLASSMLAGAWLAVFWKKLFVNYVVHTYDSVDDFERHVLPIPVALPIDWIFDTKHQHMPDPSTAKTETADHEGKKAKHT